MNAHKKAIQSLWKGLCTVYVRVSTIDPSTGRNVFMEQVLVDGVPCRLSFSRIDTTTPNSGAAKVTQEVKVFLDPAVQVPTGSKLVVTQNGVTGEYSQSGEPAVYTNHKEIPLALFTKWA